MRISACRSCMKPIIWTITTNGKKMPADSLPSAAGSFDLRERPDEPEPIAEFVPPAHRHGDVANLHESHFSTCPNAAQHRKKGIR